MSNCWADRSGLATVGHGWARAHPTSARVGREIYTNSKSFSEDYDGGGGSRLCMSLKVHHISSMNTSRKCVCPLQIVHAYLASGGFAPDPHRHRGSAPGPRWGTSIPQTLCALPTSKPWRRHWLTVPGRGNEVIDLLLGKGQISLFFSGREGSQTAQCNEEHACRQCSDELNLKFN